MDDVSNKGSSKNTYASRGDQPKYELLSQIILLNETTLCVLHQWPKIKNKKLYFNCSCNKNTQTRMYSQII